MPDGERDRHFLDQPTMAWFTRHYAADSELHGDPRLSPMRANDLSGLAPAVVVTAEFDPLRDEGRRTSNVSRPQVWPPRCVASTA